MLCERTSLVRSSPSVLSGSSSWLPFRPVLDQLSIERRVGDSRRRFGRDDRVSLPVSRAVSYIFSVHRRSTGTVNQFAHRYSSTCLATYPSGFAARSRARFGVTGLRRSATVDQGRLSDSFTCHVPSGLVRCPFVTASSAVSPSRTSSATFLLCTGCRRPRGSVRPSLRRRRRLPVTPLRSRSSPPRPCRTPRATIGR